ncbi:hypothetical protein MTO96_016962 [Rhipicephalus appendiculatus]
MTQYLPPNLLALFAPRDPIPYLPPTDKLPHEKTQGTYTGVSQYLNLFEDPKDTPPPTRVETREERIERKRREKAEQVAYKLEQDIALWDPYNNSSGTLDPFKTLFVARINYDTSESKLRREFEVFGPIKKYRTRWCPCRLSSCTTRSPASPGATPSSSTNMSGTCTRPTSMLTGRRLMGAGCWSTSRGGRTVKGWLPRRLGGGLGGTRRGGPDVNTKHSGREDSRMDERYMDRDGRDREDRMVRGGEPRGGGGGGERDRERERRRSRSRDRERRHRSGKDDRERRERRRDRPDRERPDRERPDRERPDRERPDRERPERDRGDRDRGDRDRRDRGDRPDRADDGGEQIRLVDWEATMSRQMPRAMAAVLMGGSGYNSESQSSFKMERTEEYN